MAHVADHLSVLALEQQYRSCTDVTTARHFQTIWLLAKGHEIAPFFFFFFFLASLGEQLLARYNAFGPRASVICGAGTAPGPDADAGAAGKLRARLVRRRRMVGSGPRRRWRAGWRVSSGSPPSYLNGAGRR